MALGSVLVMVWLCQLNFHRLLMPEKLRVEWEESLAFCASPSCENKNRQTALILLHDFSFPALAKD